MGFTADTLPLWRQLGRLLRLLYLTKPLMSRCENTHTLTAAVERREQSVSIIPDHMQEREKERDSKNERGKGGRERKNVKETWRVERREKEGERGRGRKRGCRQIVIEEKQKRVCT